MNVRASDPKNNQIYACSLRACPQIGMATTLVCAYAGTRIFALKKLEFKLLGVGLCEVHQLSLNTLL